MQTSPFTLTTDDGFALHVYRWLPDPHQKPRAIVQIAHGLAEHAARYARAAEALTKAGFAVYANDHRGAGKSVKSDEDLGYFADRDGWNQVVSDMLEVQRTARKEWPGLPCFMLGHSMGSFLTQQFLFQHGDTLRGAILSGSNGDPGPLRVLGLGAAWIESKRLGRKGRSRLLNALSFGAYNNAFKPARTEFDWLSRDPLEVDKYIADPHCGYVATTALWLDLLGGLGTIADPANQARVPKNLPIYIFSGEKDPVSNATRGLKQLLGAYQKAGLTRVSHKIYPGGRHEMFNETNRDEVTSDLITWIDGVLAS